MAPFVDVLNTLIRGELKCGYVHVRITAFAFAQVCGLRGCLCPEAEAWRTQARASQMTPISWMRTRGWFTADFCIDLSLAASRQASGPRT